MNPQHQKPLALIVDDSETDRLIARRILSDLGYRTEEVADGEAAIAAAAANKPALVLMDVVMEKGMDGFEACQEIKEADVKNEISIIICSTKARQTDEEWARTCGAGGYIVKPLTQEIVMSALNRLKLRQAA